MSSKVGWWSRETHESQRTVKSARKNLLLLLVVVLGSGAPSRRWGSDSLVGGTSVTDDPQVDSGRDRIVLLVVDLGQGIVVVDRGLAQVTHGSAVDHISNDVLSNGLVFWPASGRGLASNKLDVSSALLVSSSISSLLGHFEKI